MNHPMPASDATIAKAKHIVRWRWFYRDDLVLGAIYDLRRSPNHNDVALARKVYDKVRAKQRKA